MKAFRTMALIAAACAAIPARAETPLDNGQLRITRSADRSVITGAAQNFAGAVRISSLFQTEAPARASGGAVFFEPNARTVWHDHPLGQTLIVTEGVGRIQEWGGPVQEIRAGDIVWIPPGVKHWHGASPDRAMAHIAIAEALGGKSVTWMEPVSGD